VVLFLEDKSMRKEELEWQQALERYHRKEDAKIRARRVEAGVAKPIPTPPPLNPRTAVGRRNSWQARYWLKKSMGR
jgi:hypothetical protein